ncbi:MAG: glycosyltransferase family 39 protein [Acidobacteria bacterium]|nr:glycosyltransferase family 39 protein [Acidobacteriota bacterium]
MDDVDAVNAQIARNMLDSGDWVTARINGVVYLEKSPLGFWLMAVSYVIFGVHDWSARLPTALGAIGLMWVTAALGRWGFGRRVGFYAGLAVGASAGLFLFTRITIPDVLLTLAVATALYCFLRAVEEEDGRWAWGYWGAMGAGLLLKGLLAALVPMATAGLYLLLTRRLFERRTWRLLRPSSGVLLMLAIYAPWVVLATLRNPPIFDFTWRSEPGVYRGFFWFYFINEHILRFLNLRYPRDYNTVPRVPFLLLHLVWIFPWSAFLPAALRNWRWPAEDRPGRVRLLAVLWIGFLLAFLSLSTTQEYYSMPCYPAFALLAGAALAEAPNRWISWGYGALAALGAAMGAATGVILYLVRQVNPVGDISSALTENPDAYTLALGHMSDLTLQAFAYLRGPLLLAGVALAVGTVAAWFLRRGPVGPLCLAGTMVLFTQAAYRAMAIFDPYMSSRPLAEAIAAGPEGGLVLEGHYYPFSSVVFYTNRRVLLLHGRAENLVYGSAAPGAPPVFLEDDDLARLWKRERLVYLVAPVTSRPKLEAFLGPAHLFAERGGKCVLTNAPAGIR